MSARTGIRACMQPVVHLVSDTTPKRFDSFSLWPPHSADLEITVQLLVQVDKLVQLIESPVFTCEASVHPPLSLAKPFYYRPPTTTPGAREIPTPFQVSVRAPHASSPKLRFPCTPEPARRRQLCGLPAHSTKVVSFPYVPSSAGTGLMILLQNGREPLVNALQAGARRH